MFELVAILTAVTVSALFIQLVLPRLHQHSRRSAASHAIGSPLERPPGQHGRHGGLA